MTGGGQVLAGVADGHLGPQVVHHLHDVDGLLVGHGGTLQPAVLNGAGRLQHLVFVAGQLGRAGLALDETVVLVIDPQALGVVDVFHHHVAFGAVDTAEPVGHGGGGGSQHGGAAVLPGESDAVGHVHAVLIFHTAALNAVRPAEHHFRKIQPVHAHVQQCAAGQFRHHDAPVLGDGVGQIGGEHFWLTNDAGGEGVADDGPHGLVAGPDGLRHQQPLGADIADGVVRLAGVDSEGLFTQDVLAEVGAKPHMAVVVGVRCGDVDEVHRRVREHLLIGAVGPLGAVPGSEGFGPCPVPGGNGVELYGVVAGGVQLADGVGHQRGNVAGTQNTQIHAGDPPDNSINYELSIPSAGAVVKKRERAGHGGTGAANVKTL